MSRDQPILVIFNPAAGRGRGTRRQDRYLSLLQQHLGDVEHVVTERAGHERELADRAIAEGFTTIIAVGGDGTWSNVADRIVRSGRSDVTLGLLPAGTGNDFGKSLGITSHRVDAALRGIANGRRRKIDIGRVAERYFLNVVGFGFDIAVIDDAADFPLLKGDVLYQFCALRQLFRFPGLPLEISGDSGAPLRRRHLMLVIANANYFGGSFHIAPRARLDDGRLDAVSIFDAGPLRRARLFMLVGKGRHERSSRVKIQQAKRFHVEFDGPVRYEVDGEVYDTGGRGITVEAVPQALSVFTPERH